MRPLWPLGGALLAGAPGTRRASELLVARLEPHADRIREALLRAPGVPLHSDLHDENILDDDGVPGFIDFGEALVGPAAWEFAAIAYFLDWPTADAVLAAYLDDEHLVDSWSRMPRRSASASGSIAGRRTGTWKLTRMPTTRRSWWRRCPDVTATRATWLVRQGDPALDDRHHGTRDPHLGRRAIGIEVGGGRQA